MKLQSSIASVILIFSMISLCSCSTLSKLSAGQIWSENYSLMKGVQANDPAIIDGNPKTIGNSQYVESSSDTIRSLGAGSESVVLLPEPRSIHRVVIYSSNLDTFDLWVADTQGRWEKIKEVKSNKDKIIDLRISRAVHATGIKIRVRRTVDDTELRRKNVRTLRGFRIYSGNTRAVAKIGEIELYGFVPKADEENPPTELEKEETAEDELDRIMRLSQ